jgi:hypothetical protein
MSSYAEIRKSLKNRVIWLLLLNGARYKDKKPHFEISVKLRNFGTQYRPISQKKF